jgi:hypothetical protein
MEATEMDRGEARGILATHLGSFRLRSYADLVGLMGEVHVAEVSGPSGAEYQTEIEVIWDSPREKTNIRVFGSIDDGRLPGALVPVSDSFIVAPDGTFVGE